MGKAFICELTQMFRAYNYADSSALESAALQAAVVMPTLLLHKTHHRSKAKDHRLCLEHPSHATVDGWRCGSLDEGGMHDLASA